jgi:beta-N-acetylhexosaminidase
LSLQNIGQIVMTGIEGTQLTPEEKEYLTKENIGGVILFTRNYEDPAQLAELTNSIQECRGDRPLFISADHEGGRVFRFKKGFTHIPSMLDLAKKDSPKTVYEAHRIIGQELKACGVNFNFSPCCDVLRDNTTNAIGDRAFSNDPTTVEKFVSSAIRGLQTTGITACAKHFPGHGNTSKDSHFDLPHIKQSLQEFHDIDLVPFNKASRSKVEFFLMAHLVCDAIDPDLPCTLSKKAYDFLRSEMKFRKCIISDDMNMEAITKKWDVEEAAVIAFNAGCDILCYRTFEYGKRAQEALKQAYKDKVLLKDRVDESLKRIAESKDTYLTNYKPIYLPEMAKAFEDAKGEEFLKSLAD